MQKLKDSVELKFGRKIVYQKDCKDLSNCILNVTSYLVSPSTLRRFYGFLSTNSNPSRATLDILSQYCGYKSWDSFKEKNISFDSIKEPIIDIWFNAKELAIQLSTKSLENIKNQYPLGFHTVIQRDFATNRISNFIESKYKALSFVGPSGYGKTSLVAKWYENYCFVNKNSNDIVLFLPISALENWGGKEVFIEEWLSSLLGFKSSSLFGSFQQNPKLAPGKFILIVDALDSLTLSVAKTERVYNDLHRIINSLPSEWFKLIVNSRVPSWENFIGLAVSLNHWYTENGISNGKELINIPKLNPNEIQKILDLTINTKKNHRVLFEEFNPDLREMICLPSLLELFIQLALKSSSKLYPSRVELIAEFFRKEIALSQYSDEKFDIINKIIELQTKDYFIQSIKKNDLKDIYPIHLKLSGNYYIAYEQLVSSGIVMEDLFENEFGIPTNMVRIGIYELFIYLLNLKYIEKEGDISINLFKRIQDKFQNTEVLEDSIILLFEMAYKAKKVEALKSLFDLDERTLDRVMSKPSIYSIIISDESLCSELINVYLSKSKGKKYLIDFHVDLNSIVSSRYLIDNSILEAKSYSDTFKATILKNIQRSYDLDLNWISKFQLANPDLPNLNDISPKMAGLFCACISIYYYFKHERIDENIDDLINKFKKEFSQNWSLKDNLTFELALVIGLLYTRNYKLLYKRTGKLFKDTLYNNLTSEGKALYLFSEFAKWEETKKFDCKVMIDLEGVSSVSPFWISHQSYIIEKSWFAMFEFTQGKIENAYNLYRNATEMSSIAGYKNFELRLLRNLSTILYSIGEAERAEECNVFVKSFAEKSGVKFELL